MHNTTRTLLILGALAIGGVSLLGYGAYRYARALEGRGLSTDEGARDRVDAFIEVRRGMRSEIDSWSASGAPRAEALTLTRDRALGALGLGLAEYVELRRVYRAWRAGRLRAGSPLGGALEARRRELERVDLGAYESLDS